MAKKKPNSNTTTEYRRIKPAARYLRPIRVQTHAVLPSAIILEETCCIPLCKGIKIARNMPDQSFNFASRLRALTTELGALERELKAGAVSDPAGMHDLRHALDELRMTAWTAIELHNARPERKATMASFLAAERIRRFAQMIRDFSTDLEHQDLTWESGGIQSLFDSVAVLQTRLEKLIRQHRATYRNLKDEQG